MISAPGPGVPWGFDRGGLLSLSRPFHDGGKIHLVYHHVTRGSLLGVFPKGPVGVHVATCHSVGAQVPEEIFVPFLTKGLNNRFPHSWRGVGKIDKERHTYFL